MDPKSSKTPSIIDNVPNEIWVSILESSIPKFHSDWRDVTVYESRWSVIVAMSQVCSRWRDLALATSSLWTRIVLRVRADHCSPTQNLVSLFLERSKSQPLCVKLMVWETNLCQPKIQDCILEILATIPRWKTGYVDIVQTGNPDLTHWHLMGPCLDTSAPLLERLYIGVDYIDVHEAVDTVILPDKLWTTSSRLAELYINFQGDVWVVRDHVHGAPANPTQSQVPYNHLTHLRLASSRVLDGFAFSLAHVLTILSRAPNLVSFFLQDSRRRPWSRVGSPGRKPVVLQYLKHMHLLTFGKKRDLLPTYLDLMVIAPSLETLTLSDTKNFDRASYTRFINQSSCHLHELHLVDVEITAEVFLECMRLSPTLKVVHLSSIDALANADVCRAMAEWTEGCFRAFNLVPKLQMLSLTNDPFSEPVSHDVEKGMAEMLKSRLCPPDGSKGAFTTLAIPSVKIESPSLALQEMYADPWSLQLSANDGSYEDHRLWEVYGGQLW